MTARLTVRDGLPPLPSRVSRLSLDERGYPVPWFVKWVDGKPDFRIVDEAKAVDAVRDKLCWICGQPLGANMVFVSGCLMIVTRVSVEPPSHRDCAEFAVRACPFILMPKAKYRPAGLDETQAIMAASNYLRSTNRNPGVFALWNTRSYSIRGGGIIVGNPTEVRWYMMGRAATRAEALASLGDGAQILAERASSEREVLQVKAALAAAMAYLPKEE